MTYSIILLNTLTFIALMNPFGNVPLFISMTEDMDKNTKNKVMNIVILTGLVITLIFAIIGNFLMAKFFQIGIEELKMAGGLILIVIATRGIVFSENEKKDQEISNQPTDITTHLKQAIIPMAFPMLVGPGLLTATLIARVKYGLIATCMAVFISFIIIYFIFWLGKYLEKILNKLILFILGRVMQIFILAIGFRIFLSGLFNSMEAYGIISHLIQN